MNEVEIKVKNIDKEKIIGRLKELGAKKIFWGKILDYRFDTLDRVLSNKGKVLRIRKKGNYSYLNYKGKKTSKENIVGREEVGVRISNFNVMHNILNEVGFIKIFHIEKYREEYELDGIKFDIDKYEGMDPILEIEADSYEKVEKYMKKLGIKQNEIKRVYMRELIEASLKKIKKSKKK